MKPLTSVIARVGLGLLIVCATLVSTGSSASATEAGFTEISPGEYFTCAVKSSGKAFCWGWNQRGVLGNNNLVDRSAVPVDVVSPPWAAITSVSSGGTYACALTRAGEAYCWGRGDLNGEMGDGSFSSWAAPHAVSTYGVLAGKKLGSLSGGLRHICVLDISGKAYCWGHNTSGELGNNATNGDLFGGGEPAPVAVDTSGVLKGKTIAAISAGGGHTCALDTGGTPYCWGRNDFGQLGDGYSGPRKVDGLFNDLTHSSVPVAVDTSGVLKGKTLTAISAGFNHTCALDTEGKAYCWGSNWSGELGDGYAGPRMVHHYGFDITYSSVPVAVDTAGVLSGKVLTSIKLGQSSTCALDGDGRAYCWGANSDGELGNNSVEPSNVPVAVDTSGVLSGKTLTSINIGSHHTCALDRDGQAYCWGANSDGQLGNNSTRPSLVPVEVVMAPDSPTGVTVAAGAGQVQVSWAAPVDHGATAITSYLVTASDGGGACSTTGSLSCIVTGLHGHTSYTFTVTATNSVGTSSASMPSASVTPAFTVPSAPRSVTADAGDAQATVSWNAPVYDSGDSVTGYTVTATPGGSKCVTTSALSCVITGLVNGTPYTFSVSASNSIGSSIPSRSMLVVPRIDRAAGPSFSSMSAGASSTCAINSNGRAYCWGLNTNGELGNGSTKDSVIGVAVDTSGALAGKTLVAIASGGDDNPGHTCTLDSDGKAYCWGWNSEGQLGNNSRTDSSFPVAVDTSGALSGKRLTAITVGAANTCALDTDGKAYCWGFNGWGSSAAPPSSGPSLVPVAVDTSGVLAGKTLTAITEGYSHTCALDTDGKAYCWGMNTSGQLGTGGAIGYGIRDAEAVDTSGVLAGKTLTAISAGHEHTCAMDADGNAYCWGDDAYGQLGDGDIRNVAVPVPVLTSGALNGKVLVALDAGLRHTCAVDTEGKAYCWGLNGSRQLGNKPIGRRTPLDSENQPVLVNTDRSLNGKTLVAVTTGTDHSCALTADGKGYCWGGNYYGQMGNGDNPPWFTPPARVATAAVAPLAPTNVTAVAGIRRATVSWAESADNGSPEIHSYTVTSSPGGKTCVTTQLSCLISDLGNNQAYSFTVTAINLFGSSVPSSASSMVITPADSPTQPRGVSAESSNGRITVSWSPPADNGGASIIGYTVTSAPGGKTCTTSGSTSCDVSGLVNGTAYSFTVTATNAFGMSAASTPSAAVTQLNVASAPTSITAVSGNGRVTVSWSPPADSGGTAITGYTAVASPDGGTCTATFGINRCVITGLDNGVEYTIEVFASNSIGVSQSSQGVLVTPRAPVTPPMPPRNVLTLPGNGHITVSWSPPADNGGASIIGYTVTSAPGGKTCTTSGSTSCDVSGLVNGTAYSFTVTATNAFGMSAASTPSAAVTQLNVASAPTSVTAVSGIGRITVSWSPPADSGSTSIVGYMVRYSTNGGKTWSIPVKAASASTSYIMGRLVSGTAYTFQIATVNSSGISDWSSQTSSTQSLSRKSQVITFAAPRKIVVGKPEGTLTMKTSAVGLRVSIAVSPGSARYCSVIGSKVHAKAVGRCTVVATQVGSSAYLPAVPVTRFIQVTKK